MREGARRARVGDGVTGMRDRHGIDLRGGPAGGGRRRWMALPAAVAAGGWASPAAVAAGGWASPAAVAAGGRVGPALRLGGCAVEVGRAIRTGQLHASPRLHIRPIDVVVDHGSRRDLVSRWVSRLDAFSGYPVRA